MNMLDQIQNGVSGQPAFDRGATAQTKTRTLGELEFMQNGARSRTDRKISRLETFIRNIARKIIVQMKANFDLEQTVQITGETPQTIIEAFKDNFDPRTGSITFTKDDIVGEYDVDVRPGSTLSLDKTTRLQIMGQILQQSMQLAQLPALPPFVQVLIGEMLKDYDIKSLEVAFQEQQQKAEQAAAGQAITQQTELDKVKAEADKRKAQAQQINTETAIQTGEALHRANAQGILPEAIELGRSMGQFPSGGPNGA